MIDMSVDHFWQYIYHLERALGFRSNSGSAAMGSHPPNAERQKTQPTICGAVTCL